MLFWWIKNQKEDCEIAESTECYVVNLKELKVLA